MMAIAKAALCRVIATCPVRYWARMSAIVRRVWGGFRDA